jgi:hypothetical protein
MYILPRSGIGIPDDCRLTTKDGFRFIQLREIEVAVRAFMVPEPIIQQ